MNRLAYSLYDVFTEERFTGNPLAVFLDAPALQDELMALIANELNLSETVFVSSEGDLEGYALRIFTPQVELPFAGHPTIGAACALREQRGAGPKLNFRLAAGEFSISVGGSGAQFTAPRSSRRVDIALTRHDAARLLGLRVEDVLGSYGADAGVPFACIELTSRTALADCSISLEHWRRNWAGSPTPHIYTYYRHAGGQRIDARMFAPAMGITEDPATGGAVAALAAILPDGVYLITQGEDMGRRSVIRLGVLSNKATLGGSAVLVGKGELYLPE